MKINDLNQPGVGGTGAAGASSGVDGRTPGRTAGARVTGEDRAELSGTAARISLEANGESPERLARVAELHKLVQTGRYDVNAAEVAHKIVDESLEPGGKR